MSEWAYLKLNSFNTYLIYACSDGKVYLLFQIEKQKLVGIYSTEDEVG